MFMAPIRELHFTIFLDFGDDLPKRMAKGSMANIVQ
jgi:hypothetical protein